MQQLTKTVSDNRLFTFDFSQVAELLIDGDTITGTPTITSPGLTFAAIQVSGALVSVRIGSGTAGVNYTVTCEITTSSGSTIMGVGYLMVTCDC